MLAAASPKKVSETCPVFRYLAAHAKPAPSGICPPTMPWPPMKPFSRSKRCIEPPFPFEQPVAFPKSSAMIERDDMPRASA